MILPDRSRAGRPSIAKTDDVALGLALLSTVCIPGVPLTDSDIAAWCGCSRQAIQRIERIALRKLRTSLMFGDRALWGELREHLFSARQPAGRPARLAPAW